ncbi:MAG: alkane 1-monooxygenase, partial [Alphaproteobacteria bacterium]|nr:alkane 1-monooxygenase [Alphaproteobacteria bacterium]
YPPMTFMAMIPPVWRRVFNPKVRAWRQKFYPEIEDWTPYKTWAYPVPKNAE